MSQRNTAQSGSYYVDLLQPLSGESPCGENLEYDPAFIMLQSRLQPKLDVEYGSFVEAAEPINWAEIERDCLALLEKSKDIRLFVALIRCRIRQIGIAALPEGLLALKELLIRYPDDLYPQLLDEGEFEPLMRANALAELEDANGLLMDLRNQPLPKAAGLQITVKEFEKAHASPREEGALAETTVSALRHEWKERDEKNIAALNEAAAYLREIKSTLSNISGTDTPDFVRLDHILQLFFLNAPTEIHTDMPVSEPEFIEQQEENRALPSPTTKMTESNEPSPPLSTRPVQRGIDNRSDALLRLREIRSWFSRMEPSSPVILLLEFAESTVGKSFSELLKIVPSEIIEKMSEKTE